jgi:hypothetical protein
VRHRNPGAEDADGGNMLEQLLCARLYCFAEGVKGAIWFGLIVCWNGEVEMAVLIWERGPLQNWDIGIPNLLSFQHLLRLQGILLLLLLHHLLPLLLQLLLLLTSLFWPLVTNLRLVFVDLFVLRHLLFEPFSEYLIVGR